MGKQGHLTQAKKTTAQSYRWHLLAVAGLFGFGAWATEKATPSPDFVIRQEMVSISHQLGVTCSHCHHMEDLQNASMETYKTAAAHLKMVEELNSRHVRGLPKVDCFMCHQGKSTVNSQRSMGPVPVNGG